MKSLKKFFFGHVFVLDLHLMLSGLVNAEYFCFTFQNLQQQFGVSTIPQFSGIVNPLRHLHLHPLDGLSVSFDDLLS